MSACSTYHLLNTNLNINHLDDADGSHSESVLAYFQQNKQNKCMCFHLQDIVNNQPAKDVNQRINSLATLQMSPESDQIAHVPINYLGPLN